MPPDGNCLRMSCASTKPPCIVISISIIITTITVVITITTSILTIVTVIMDLEHPVFRG